MFLKEHSDRAQLGECVRNISSLETVPAGTLCQFEFALVFLQEHWTRFAHKFTLVHSKSSIAFEMQSGLCCRVALVLLTIQWDALSLLPIRRAASGKTTTAINLAASFAAAEVNTLLVDCDPQSNATSGLGFAKDPDRISSYHLLMGAASAEEALLTTELEQLWLIPAHKNLIGANLELVDAEGREFRLREALAPLRDRFQFVVLDCPPALDLLTLNALVAADAVLIPMQGEYFALEGISELLDTIERIRAGLNPELGIEGVVLTMFDERTNLAQQVMS